jgi:RimJ/RimL family protein N-acetyltransferase
MEQCKNVEMVNKLSFIDWNYYLHKLIFQDNSEIKIWKKLDNNCFIGTLGYSENNINILMGLLQSFAEQYGEEIDYEAAREELMIYCMRGKLFVYFDENMRPVSMNGVTYNEDNVSVGFDKDNGDSINSLYFYGLSTIPEYRGRGACGELIKFAIEYAFYNNFDLVYARTDLVGSKSERLMRRAGMNICMEDGKIITEWVQVTDDKGDYRLHLWLPLKDGISLYGKDEALYADGCTREVEKVMKLGKRRKYEKVYS